MRLSNPYKNSTILKKLLKEKAAKKQLKLAFLDIDTTFTGHTSIIKKTREKLEKLGFALVFVTARTEEIVMSEKEYKNSQKLGFSRPQPKLGKTTNGYTYIDPGKLHPLLVDPDIIIGSTGTQIYVRQETSGYVQDKSFLQTFSSSSPMWKKDMLFALTQIDPTHEFIAIDPIEFEENYKNNKTNVYPTKFRIKLNFKNLENKLRFYDAIKKNESLYSNIRCIDDSHPRKNSFTVYITPKGAYKAQAVEHVVNALCKEQIDRTQLDVILAGDSYPDLNMLLYGARETHATSILVGGSRLTEAIVEKEITKYAGEDISHVKNGLTQHVDNVSGYYRFVVKSLQEKVSNVRNFIIGDYAFPKTQGPETILAYLDSLE